MKSAEWLADGSDQWVNSFYKINNIQKVSEVIPFAVIVMKRDFGMKPEAEP